MNKVLGIDLGTTYSCVSCIDAGGKPVVLKNAEGELTTPSVVYFESAQNVVVGSPAKESSKLYPGDAVSYVKQSMGQSGAAWEIQDAQRTPEEISSYILKKVVSDAVDALRSENKLEEGEELTGVVITCPAYFGVNEREATHKAGELAGLRVLGIINEPTAAAITYGVTDMVEDSVVLVYDLGGGTFDVTMIDVREGSIRVVCTGGDQLLGGRLWDERILEYVAREFTRQTGNEEDILSDPETFQELSLSAERAKKMLSAREKAPIAINYKGDRARVELTRDLFDELTADLLERTIDLTREVLEEGVKKGYAPDEVSEILLVGGSTRMPQVTTRIAEEFEASVKIYDPDEAVAKGAAIYASRQAFFNAVLDRTAKNTGRSKEQIRQDLESGRAVVKNLAMEAGLSPEEFGEGAGIDIVNVASRSFGTIAYEKPGVGEKTEVLYNMILKNTELPAKETKRFYTVADNQKTVNIRVLESPTTQRNAHPLEGNDIGETVLDLPPGLPMGSPLDIEFKLNEGGLLELRAVEATYYRKVEARFETVDAPDTKDFAATKHRVDDATLI